MKERQKSILFRGTKLFHLLMTISMFASTCYVFYDNMYDVRTETKRFMLVVGIYAFAYLVLRRTYNAYDLEMSTTLNLAYSQSIASILSGLFMYLVLVVDFLHFEAVNPLPLIGLVIVQIIFNLLWSYFISKLYKAINKPKKTIVIYADEDDLLRIHEIKKFTRIFNVQKTLAVNSQDRDYLNKIVDGYEVVFVSGLKETARNEIVKSCVAKNIFCYVLPHIGDIILMGSEHIEQFSIPVFKAARANPTTEYEFIKRLIDIIVSLFGIIVSSPFMIVTALAVRLYDKGPALYKQVRLTKDGKEFKILKFRSMRTNAESDGVARLATDNDDRITPVGKIIRACRLDELPQLFNILKGDMTLVGPRPERPEIAAQYAETLPPFELRLQAKAGLTGLAQVYGKYNTDPYDKLQMDLMYINNMSVATDFNLILATIKILFMKDSTSGVAQGQVTANAKKKK